MAQRTIADVGLPSGIGACHQQALDRAESRRPCACDMSVVAWPWSQRSGDRQWEGEAFVDGGTRYDFTEWPLRNNVVSASLATVDGTNRCRRWTDLDVAKPSRIFAWTEPARELRILVDQDEVCRLALSSQAAASALNTAISGSAITQVRDPIDPIDVVARGSPANPT
jgi:hypothetical protein